MLLLFSHIVSEIQLLCIAVIIITSTTKYACTILELPCQFAGITEYANNTKSNTQKSAGSHPQPCRKFKIKINAHNLAGNSKLVTRLCACSVCVCEWVNKSTFSSSLPERICGHALEVLVCVPAFIHVCLRTQRVNRRSWQAKVHNNAEHFENSKHCCESYVSVPRTSLRLADNVCIYAHIIHCECNKPALAIVYSTDIWAIGAVFPNNKTASGLQSFGILRCDVVDVMKVICQSAFNWSNFDTCTHHSKFSCTNVRASITNSANLKFEKFALC